MAVIMSKCGISSGTCDKECATLEVEEDVECGCSCQLTPSDCRADQAYRADLCSCQCRDILGRQTCLDSGGMWDESACVCGCGNAEVECGLGEFFSRQTCSCVQNNKTDNNNKTALAAEESSKQDEFTFPTFELIVILTLLSIILVLIITVFSLITKIQRMQHKSNIDRIRAQTKPEDQYSESNTTSDEGGFAEKEGYTQINTTEAAFAEINCSTPSSGFYSELGHETRTELDHLYQSAEQVRNKKNVNKVNTHFRYIYTFSTLKIWSFF